MPKMAIEMLFLKEISTESEFCEVYNLRKQCKVNETQPFIDITSIPEIHLNATLFNGQNTLPDVMSYQNRAIPIGEVMQRRFLLMVKSNDAIYKERKIVSN